ncbi:hypothetical protein lerEdw1_014888 [Lerista edwardsae]|nr:hypothetical protein lerEdw1_014888 [Lerista edwardsae]
MACSHNVVFLLDTASSVQKVSLHRGILRILNYLGCRFGLAKVRWGFKFFDSLGAQGRTSQVGNFRELGSCSWENFEELLEARFGGQAHSSRLPGPKPRAALIRNILKEALLDYQWDRPEIASPAKPVLRSQKNKSALPLDKPPANWNSSDGFVNAVFLFSPCPHSQREVLQFVSGSHIHLSDEPPTSQDLTEKFVPKGIQDMMAGKKITLYWVDTAEWSQVLESSDHVGYWMLVAEVSPSGSCLPCTGIISPITDTVAVFSLLSYEFTAESDKALLQMAAEGNVSKDEDFSLPEIMNSMLNHVDDSREDDSAISAEIPSPEWAQQELARTHRWNPAVVEGWYLSSNLCGASSHLMESFRLQQAPSVAEDETPNPEMELTHRLSEFYRRKVSESTASSHQQGHKKRRMCTLLLCLS